MSNYIPGYQKKNRIFVKRENALIHAIKHSDSEEALFVLGEKVREAKINVFKSRKANAATFRDGIGENQESKWKSMSTDEIVDIYRKKVK